MFKNVGNAYTTGLKNRCLNQNLLTAHKDNYKANAILDSGQLELNSPIVQQPERTEIMPRLLKWVENA